MRYRIRYRMQCDIACDKKDIASVKNPDGRPLSSGPTAGRLRSAGLCLAPHHLRGGSQHHLAVSQLRNPNYEGSVNYLRIILENGKIASEIPEVPAERYDELHCATTEQLKLYERPAAASSAPSQGNSSLWAADIAGAPRVDRQWAYNGTTCARLGSGKISVLFWLDHLLSALRHGGEY